MKIKISKRQLKNIGKQYNSKNKKLSNNELRGELKKRETENVSQTQIEPLIYAERKLISDLDLANENINKHSMLAYEWKQTYEKIEFELDIIRDKIDKQKRKKKT